jgi:hypothetical protein
VMRIERACRITGVNREEHLRASHCKPWRDSTNDERLDGENGLLLTPSIDHLFLHSAEVGTGTRVGRSESWRSRCAGLVNLAHACLPFGTRIAQSRLMKLDSRRFRLILLNGARPAALRHIRAQCRSSGASTLCSLAQLRSSWISGGLIQRSRRAHLVSTLRRDAQCRSCACRCRDDSWA